MFLNNSMKILQNAFQTLKIFQKMSYYAVARGHQVGIYDTWYKCEKQVKNFKGARYKKFPTHEEAETFINTVNKTGVNQVTQFSPQEIAVALGKKGPAEWKEAEVADKEDSFTVNEFWPESDGDCFDIDNITDGEMLSALAEVEGLPETSTSITGKRKLAEPHSLATQSKQLKLDSKIWKPIGLKRVGAFDFQIDSEGFVIVYTDGSCINNGQANAVAGFGVYFDDDHPLNASKPVRGRVTNNAGEIQASIHAIKVAKDLGIKKLCISTDSQFLINAITSWIATWKRKNWCLKNGDAVKNVVDFKELDGLLLDNSLAVKWNYVKAHAGIKGNEMADKFAREGSAIYKQQLSK